MRPSGYCRACKADVEVRGREVTLSNGAVYRPCAACSCATAPLDQNPCRTLAKNGYTLSSCSEAERSDLALLLLALGNAPGAVRYVAPAAPAAVQLAARSYAVARDPAAIGAIAAEACGETYEALAHAALTHPRATWFTVNWVKPVTPRLAAAAIARDEQSIAAMAWPLKRGRGGARYEVAVPEELVRRQAWREFQRYPARGLRAAEARARASLSNRRPPSPRPPHAI